MKKTILVTCDTKLRIPVASLHGIQGALKFLSDENAKKLREHLVGDGKKKKGEGINFPFHVWKEKPSGKWWIIDGHGRHAVLKDLVKEGWKVDGAGVPCVEIEAKNFKDAKRKVLLASSVFHTTTSKGLFDFLESMEKDFKALADFALPEIHLPSFKSEFYPSPEEDEALGSGNHYGDKYKGDKLITFLDKDLCRLLLTWEKAKYDKVLFFLEKLQKVHKASDYAEALFLEASK